MLSGFCAVSCKMKFYEYLLAKIKMGGGGFAKKVAAVEENTMGLQEKKSGNWGKL